MSVSISTLPPTSPRALPQPAPLEGSPAPPVDSVDFSTIDSPTKAALLPLFNASALVNLLENLGDALDANQPLDCTLDGSIGATPLHGTFTMADPSSATAEQQGTLGTVPYHETWLTDPASGVITITGDIGATHEALTLAATDEATHIDGTIGTLAVHQSITAEADSQSARFIFDGTIGDQSMHQVLTFAPGPAHGLRFEADGRLGDAPIHVTSGRTVSEGVTRVEGQGVVLGTAVTFTEQMR